MPPALLGNEAPLLLDLVVCALVASVVLLAVSLFAVRRRGRYHLHKRLQLTLAVLLLALVAALEIALQVRHDGWYSLMTNESGAPRVGPERLEFAHALLRVHLVFAISTPLIWSATIALALRHFPKSPRPSAHSRWHARLGWAAAIDLLLTTITGIAWYAAVFVVD